MRRTSSPLVPTIYLAIAVPPVLLAIIDSSNAIDRDHGPRHGARRRNHRRDRLAPGAVLQSASRYIHRYDWWKFVLAGPCLVGLVIIAAGLGVEAWSLGIAVRPHRIRVDRDRRRARPLTPVQPPHPQDSHVRRRAVRASSARSSATKRLTCDAQGIPRSAVFLPIRRAGRRGLSISRNVFADGSRSHVARPRPQLPHPSMTQPRVPARSASAGSTPARAVASVARLVGALAYSAEPGAPQGLQVAQCDSVHVGGSKRSVRFSASQRSTRPADQPRLRVR